MSDNEAEDIDELLGQLNAREEENQQKCYRRSAVRIAQEIRRRAKAEQRLLPYMHACFRVMVNSSSLFDAAAGRDASIELIRLLESPEQARRIQPDISDSDYEHAIHWLSSCAYDNLADNTAELLGYNSDGMHQCINDGVQVCRRTGKLQCISCFREYAAHVYCAADDMEMAIHFARQSVDNPNPASEARRWASSHTLTRMLLRSGRLQDAMESVQRGWQLVGTYHSPLEAQHKTFELYGEIMALSGQAIDPGLAPKELPPQDEYPHLHMVKDYVAAVRELMAGDFQSAIARLTPWDTLLQSRQQLSNWLQTRLRLLCAVRMSGDIDRLRSLSQELEPIARKARDWYTLRCLTQINDLQQPAMPVPTLKPFTLGPLAPKQPQTVREVSQDAATGSAQEPNVSADDSGSQVPDIPADFQPLAMNILMLGQKIQFGVDFDPVELSKARAALLNVNASAEDPPHRIHWLLHLMTFVLPPSTEAEAVWQWTQRLAELRPQDAVAMNLHATIASRIYLVDEASMANAPLTKEQIAERLRRSLDIDPSRASNFERAGEFYARFGEDSEAERCFARAFRLDRNRTSAALSLSDIYARTDRPTDALEVLDLSLREGQGDARAAWQAAVLSSYLEKYEVALTYLKRFGEAVPDHAGMVYYQAQALLALRRPDEALEAIKRFYELEPDRPFVARLIESAAHGQKRDHANTIASLELFLNESLSTVDYLPTQAIAKLIDLLWNACEWLDSTEPIRQRLLKMIVSSGMTPERYFESLRMARSKEEGVSFYIVAIHQPLPDDWGQSPGCGAGQQEWSQYAIRYGVLSTSQAKAERLALEFQAQSGLPPATLGEVQAFDQEYVDSPGIVWQSIPEPASTMLA